MQQGTKALSGGTKALRQQGTEYQSLNVASFSPFPGEYGSRRNAAHAAFLKIRQQGLHQFSGLIGTLLNKELPLNLGQTALSGFETKTVSHVPQEEKTTTPAIFDYHDLL